MQRRYRATGAGRCRSRPSLRAGPTLPVEIREPSPSVEGKTSENQTCYGWGAGSRKNPKTIQKAENVTEKPQKSENVTKTIQMLNTTKRVRYQPYVRRIVYCRSSREIKPFTCMLWAKQHGRQTKTLCVVKSLTKKPKTSKKD